MNLPSLGWTWLRAGVLAAAGLTVLDLARLDGQDAAGLAWLALASFTLALAALAPLFIPALPFLMWSRPAAWLEALRPRHVVRVALALALLAAAALLHVENGRLYVRLYLSLHLALTAATLLVAQLGFALAWPAPAGGAGGAAHPLRTRALAALAVLAWAAGFALSLVRVTGSPALRYAALERTTLLSHGLLVLQDTWGILTPVRGAADAEARAAADALTTPGPLTGAPSPPPLAGANVLLITVDSMRTDHVPTGGAIARMAGEGVVFDRAYAPSCWTIHSMSAVLTSRLPSQLRYTYVSVDTSLRMTPHASTDELVTNPANAKKVTPVPWDDPTPTLAGLLGRAGWQTASPVAYVFYRPEAGVTREFDAVDDAPYREHNVNNDGVTSAALTDAALAFLHGRARSRPFFLWIHYMDPHAPYLAQDEGAAGGGALARYDSELRLVDRELGRLLDALAADGALADTIVVIHADHGEEFREHGGQFHATTLYEEVVHVPLIVRLPARARVAPGHRAEPVSLLDLAPTLAALVGAGAGDARYLGRNLWPLLAGGTLPARPVLAECARFGRDKRMLLDWPYKLIVDRAVGTYELYDLARDPGEHDNRVESAAGVMQRLAPVLDAMP